jgi:uncharacterized protein YjbJ (UPF0337 family)
MSYERMEGKERKEHAKAEEKIDKEKNIHSYLGNDESLAANTTKTVTPNTEERVEKLKEKVRTTTH